jgi:hypothetical protein
MGRTPLDQINSSVFEIFQINRKGYCSPWVQPVFFPPEPTHVSDPLSLRALPYTAQPKLASTEVASCRPPPPLQLMSVPYQPPFPSSTWTPSDRPPSLSPRRAPFKRAEVAAATPVPHATVSSNRAHAIPDAPISRVHAPLLERRWSHRHLRLPGEL